MSPGRRCWVTKLLIRTFGTKLTEVHHDGDVGLFAGLDGAIDGHPLGSGEVRGLDADHHSGIVAGLLRSGRGIHVLHVLFDFAAAHAMSDDIEKRQHTGLGAIDDAILEIGEIPPAGTAGIGHGGDADSKGEAVGIDAEIAAVSATRARAGVDVHVHVYQAGSDVKSVDVDHLEGLRRRNVGGDGRDLVVLNGDIPDGTEIIFGVDDVTILEQKIVLILCEGECGQE